MSVPPLQITVLLQGWVRTLGKDHGLDKNKYLVKVEVVVVVGAGGGGFGVGKLCGLG